MLRRFKSLTAKPAIAGSTGGLLLAALSLAACSSDEGGGSPGTGGASAAPTGGAVATGGLATTGGANTASGGTLGATGGSAGTAGAQAGGGHSAGGGAGIGGNTPAGASGGGAGGALGGSAGTAGGGAAGGGSAGEGGGEGPTGPAMLSETGLFTQRGADGQLVLAAGVREFEPRYWLWSDAADKKRYLYLPPGTKIDTTDPDHWELPVGTKLWKSFISNGQLVETRLIERTGAGPNEYLFVTYFWETADATDARRMEYRNRRINAAGTTHDIPNGQSCERCHNTAKERVLGFSALQLNHDRPGVTLKTLTDEGLLTAPIPLTIKMPGNDQLTQDALGYLHANCGNCHNDSPGLLAESVPEPQMLLKVRVSDHTLEDTDTFKTAINQATTASAELAIPFRIKGGNVEDSAIHFRMTQRMIEDQMPPIATELQDEVGLELIRSWIMSLPPPAAP